MKFTTNEALFAWMEDEYLSEITLDAVKPPPKKTGTPPDELKFTWSLHGTGNGDVVPYRVHAKGVRTWTVDGKRGTQAIGLRDGAEASKGKGKGKGKGIHIVMDTPAAVELACDSLEVVRGKVKKGELELIPFTDYANFVVETSARVITVGELLDAFGAPADAELHTVPSPPPPREARITSTRTLTQLTIHVRGAPWIHAHNFNNSDPNGYELSVSRKGATDDEWHRALEMPHRLGPSRVTSTNAFCDDDVRWMTAIGKPLDARAASVTTRSTRSTRSTQKKKKEPTSADDGLRAYGLFVIELPRAVTIAEVLAAVGMPANATYGAAQARRRGGPHRRGRSNHDLGRRVDVGASLVRRSATSRQHVAHQLRAQPHHRRRVAPRSRGTTNARCNVRPRGQGEGQAREVAQGDPRVTSRTRVSARTAGVASPCCARQ